MKDFREPAFRGLFAAGSILFAVAVFCGLAGYVSNYVAAFLCVTSSALSFSAVFVSKR